MSSVEEEIKHPGVLEAEVVRLAQEGDAAAFEQLYRRYSGLVFSLCLRIVKNESEAEDLTQEAFLQLFRKIHTFRGEARFSTWLHRITINTALMRLRKKRHLEVSLDAPLEPGEEDSRPLVEFGEPDLRLSGVIDHVNLTRAIEQLPHGYREVFLLHDVEGYEHREIAKILGRTIGNSKSQLFKARMRLRELLQEELRGRARENRQSAQEPPAAPSEQQNVEYAKA